METIVERIRRVCQDLHISIMKMEKDLGFGNGFLNPKKIKTVSADRLFMIADYLNVSAEYLARGVESDEASPEENAMMQKIRALDEHGRKMEAEIPQKAKKPPVNMEAIEGKLNRLKELYIEGDISKEKYTAERDRMAAMLAEPPQPKKKPIMHKIIGKNFVEDYHKLSKEQQKTFWRSDIDHIDVDAERNLFVFFR